MKEKTADEVILTPMYEGEVYKYHECSNCKKEIYFEEDIFQPFHFEENIKYCPFCGKEVIRYAKPKFIEEINWNWLDEYKSVVEKMYRELEYIIYCKLDKEQIDELEEKSARGMEYFGQDRWSFPYSKGTICDIIHRITRTKVHYTEKRKLEKEFGGVKQLEEENKKLSKANKIYIKSIQNIAPVITNDYIAKSKVKEKIEELDKRIDFLNTELTKCYIEREKLGTETDIDNNETYIFYMEEEKNFREKQEEVLQELLREE